MTDVPRTEWVVALGALPAERVVGVAGELARDFAVRQAIVPRAALRLLPIVDSVHGDAFYLGEVPVARACVEVEAPDGRRSEGGAEILGDSVDLAIAIAVLDAILAGDLPGAARAASLIEEGCDRLQHVRAERAAMLAATRVDFSLMSPMGADDD
jgi:alpha-D-ribose 1-methylphosphonate 5-triphosphate synthase subunit PhnG